MTKAKYMALEDFQTLWDDAIKPAIPDLIETASTETCEAIVDELV